MPAPNSPPDAPILFTAFADGRFMFADQVTTCALGRSGVIPAAEKREGDGASPLGDWEMLRVLYRPDRESAPITGLPVAAIRPEDGWCDDPGDPAYNRPVPLPYPASCEALWREDGVYDLICVLAHNNPPVPGLGSAIFLHLARPGFTPTEGCIALERQDLIRVLSLAGQGARLKIAV